MSPCDAAGAWSGSQEVLEVVLAANAAPEPEDLGWGIRAELDIVARPLPHVARPTEKLVRLVALVALDAEILERQVDHADLRVMRVKVDHRQHHVGQVLCALRVGEQLVVLGGVEPKAPVALKGRILAPDLVDQGDQLAQALAAFEIPAAQLVLLRVQILLGAWLLGPVLAQLERRAVY